MLEQESQCQRHTLRLSELREWRRVHLLTTVGTGSRLAKVRFSDGEAPGLRSLLRFFLYLLGQITT